MADRVDGSADPGGWLDSCRQRELQLAGLRGGVEGSFPVLILQIDERVDAS